MKKIDLVLVAILMLIFVSSCDKNKVNEDGLTDEIVNLVPNSILTEIKSLGMPIHGGVNPPIIVNSYIASPFELKASNISSDEIGHVYSDYYVKFYDQNNKKLSIQMDYSNGPETGSGYGSYIVGNDNEFTVFVKVEVSENSTETGSKAKLVHIISGQMTDNGIENLYFANFMLDNYGNESGYWIENGKGRVIYDSDGFSPINDELLKSAVSNIDGSGISGK